MIYTVDCRICPKVNGLRKHDGRREKYDYARNVLQGALRDKYPQVSTVTLPCLLLVTVSLAGAVAGDCSNIIAGLEDCISVGKVAPHARKMATILHAWPLLADDSLVRGFKPAPGYDRCLLLNCGYDRVSFGVELL